MSSCGLGVEGLEKHFFDLSPVSHVHLPAGLDGPPPTLGGVSGAQLELYTFSLVIEGCSNLRGGLNPLDEVQGRNAVQGGVAVEQRDVGSPFVPFMILQCGLQVAGRYIFFGHLRSGWSSSP